MSDGLFRKILKARAITLISRGELNGFTRAVRELDEQAFCTDNRNMTVTIESDEESFIQLADSLGAIPRPLGVSITYLPGRKFGFEGYGEGFDRVKFD